MHQSWSWSELEQTGRGRRRIYDDGGDDGRVGQWDDGGRMVVMMKWDFGRAREREKSGGQVFYGEQGRVHPRYVPLAGGTGEEGVPRRYRDITAREELPSTPTAAPTTTRWMP
jgi:hypothetical protein